MHVLGVTIDIWENFLNDKHFLLMLNYGSIYRIQYIMSDKSDCEEF